MVARFGNTSRRNLAECHVDIQTVFTEVIRTYDCSILEGHRNKDRQTRMFETGKSKVAWPDGKHNSLPSQAVDSAPYPVNWSTGLKNMARFYHFAGFVQAVAERLFRAGKITHLIRWGGDWDGDRNFKDQSFDDLVHFELIGG